jgi:hypothetical protein
MEGIYYQIIILVIATLLALFTEFKDLVKEPIKKWLRAVTISLIIAALIIEVNDKLGKAVKEKKDEMQASSDRGEREKKEKETLEQLKLAFDTINGIQRNMYKQLKIEKNLNISTDTLIAKNKEIAKKQKLVLEDIDRSLNPIFPLGITVYYEVSLDNGHLVGLKNYIMRISERRAQINDSIAKIQGGSRMDTAYNHRKAYYGMNRNFFHIKRPQTVLPKELSYENGLIKNIGLFVVKAKNGKYEYSSLYSLSLTKYFEDNEPVSYEELTVDLDVRKIFVTISYITKELSNEDLKNYPENFGFKDLVNNYVEFENLNIEAKLYLVELKTLTGLTKNVSIPFTENDVILNKIYRHKTYRRKIVDSNFKSTKFYPFYEKY